MTKKRVELREPREFKALPMSVLDIENEREITALNALLGNVDDGNDVTWPGAFTKTLQENWHRVRVLWQHDSWEPPIGVPLWAKEIGREDLPVEIKAEYPEALGGLVSKIEYLDTQRGNEVLVGIKKKAITENSFGYDPIKFDFDVVNDVQVRNLRELALWDLSPVNWGMNSGARMIGVKAVVAYQDLALADEEMAWDGAAATGRVREWASDGDEVDWAKYRKAFVLFDREDPEKAGSYKLGIGDIVDGKLVAVPRGVMAAGAVLMGGRGGVDEFDESDIEGAKRHLARYYRKMERTPPWEDEEKAAAWGLVTAALKGATPDQVSALMTELKAGRVLSSRNAELVQNAVEALTALLDAAGLLDDEPEDEDEPDGEKSTRGPTLDVITWRQKLALLELETEF